MSPNPVRGVSLLAAVLLVAIVVTPANAANDNKTGAGSTSVQSQPLSNGPLDPKTFGGPVFIATPDGEVLVTVNEGELEAVAAEVRNGVAKGLIETSNATSAVMQPMGGCSDWENAVASPFGYANSNPGCAVFGYTGYWRYYQWTNTSSVQACVQNKGWSSVDSSNAIWGGMGCSGSGGSGSIHWGNVLAYTQVRGLSLSGLTGATYQWFD